jgi:hypothetical protein
LAAAPGTLSPQPIRVVAEDATTRIVAALEPLHSRGEFTPDAVKAAIETAGFPRDSISIVEVRSPLTTAEPPEQLGAAFGVHVGQTGCVVGSIRPDALTAEPKGSAVEFGCLEPFSH